MQTVFKIDLPKRTDREEEKPFIPRRVHRKSRGGCLACKRRRIKCDEAKPRCSKCTKTDSECLYNGSAGRSPKTLFVDERTSLEPSTDMYSMSVDLVGTDLDSLLEISSDSIFPDDPLSNVRILQHFSCFTSLTLGGTRCRNVMHSLVAKIAWEHSYLMHLAMAVGSAHLKRLHSDASQLRLYQQFSIAEAAHWQQGLQQYRQALTKENRDFDATVATTFLTIIFTFALDDDIPPDAYTGDDDEKFRHAINPLAATGGFRAVRDLFGQFMNTSVWKIVLAASDDDVGTFSDASETGISGLPIAFVELCDLDAESTNENNEYHYIVRLLTPLLRLEPDLENFTKLIAYSGRTWPYFQPLLLRKDPRGLLLVSYWFAALRQLNQWWLTVRARSECVALVTYLAQLSDPRIDTLLAYPASFGQADLSYLWDPPHFDSDSSSIFERYFQKTITRAPQQISPSFVS